MAMTPWVTIVIPTKNSGGWIGALLEHYAGRGWRPTLLVDDRTTDDTYDIARRFSAPVVDIHGFTFTEAVVSVTRSCVKTPWALFIHDDEAPSAALFARLAGPPPPDAAQSVAIPRRWAWREPGRPLQFARSDHWADRTGRPGTDHGWRLFRPDQVRFIAMMHTDGFVIDRWARMPPDAYYLHFEWVIRSYAQRLAKVRRYDQHHMGYGKFFENIYLPEAQPPGVVEYRDADTHAFDRLAEVYYACRGPETPIPPEAPPTGAGAAEPEDRSGLAPRPENEVPWLSG